MMARASRAVPREVPRSARPAPRSWLPAPLLLGAALAATACLGDSGTIAVSVVTAPDSTLLDGVQKIRLTLSDPRTVVEQVRGPSGFSLSLEATADNEIGRISVEGFDSADRLVAYGISPPFNVGPIDAKIVVYVAPPQSMAAAPVRLAAARAEVGVAALNYGAIIVGGRDNTNTVRGEVELYNAYDHTLARGLDLPAPRAGAAVAATIDGRAFIIGGQGGDGQASSLTWQFNTTIAPAGSYSELPNTAAPRIGERTVPLSAVRFLVTGEAAQLDAASGIVTSLSNTPQLPTQMAANLVGNDVVAVGAGASVVRFAAGAFSTINAPDALRTGHAVIPTPDGQFAVIGGGDGNGLRSDAVKIDATTGTATTIANVLETPRRRAAIARAGDLIVVAGGASGSGVILDSAELLDATTLRHLATIPLVAPRAFAEAVTLPNDQVLLIGGIDGRGRPTELLELFTPRPAQAGQSP